MPVPRSPWRLLTSMAVASRRRLVTLAAVLAGASALTLAGPLLLRAFVDRAVAGAPTASLVRVAVAYVVVGIVAEVVTVAVTYAGTGLAWAAPNELRTDLAGHVLALDIGWHRRTTAGELVERVDGDPSAVAEFLATFVIRVGAAAVTVVGMVVVVLVLDVRLGLALAAFVGLAVAILARSRAGAVTEAAAEREAVALVLGGIEERLDGLDDIRSAGAGGYAMARFDEQSGELVLRATRRQGASNRIYAAGSGLLALGAALALAGGALAARAGWVTVGTVFLLLQYVALVRRPLEEATSQLQEVQRAAGGMRRVAELRAEPLRLTDGTARLAPGPMAVELHGVTAGYADGRPVVHDLSFTVPAGTSLALVGRTGAGKTTLARLLTRQLDPLAGEVRVGGVDVRTVSADDLGRRVGLVTQDVHLFAASVRDNVALFGAAAPERRGEDSGSDGAVAAAVSAVGLDDWLARLPDGLDTPVGPGGVGLSAGEAQLLALGRLFLRDPAVVVLDEAASRLDPETAARVGEAVGLLLAGRTALVIAHRLATLEHVDAVAVLDGGRLVEHGPRADLVADPGSRFSRLVAAGLATSG